MLADPQVVEGFDDPDWGSDGWAFNETPNQPIPFFSARNCCGRPGLQVATYASGDYNEGAVGQWTWTTYPDSYIDRADMGGLDSEMTYGIDEHMLFTGLYSPGRGAYTSQIFQTGNFVGQTHNHPSVPGGAADENNLAVFGMKAFSVPSRERYGLVAMRGAVLYLGDRRPPTIESSEQSYDTSQWTNADTASVRLRAHDDGLGLSAIGVARVILVGDQYWLGLHTPPCTGNRRGRCQTDFDTANDANFPTGRMQYRLDSLPEGLTELHASAHEISGGQYGTPAFAPTWTAKIDRTPPTLAITGELKEKAGGFVSDGASMRIVAADPYSGTRSVRVSVDGEPQGSDSTCSTDGCTITRDFALSTAELGEGEHRISVTATDALNQSAAPVEWTVNTDDSGPLVNFSGALAGVSVPALTKDSYGLTAVAEEADELLTGAGVSDVRFYVDDQEVGASPAQTNPAAGASLSRTSQIDTSQLDPGDHELRAVGRDRLGNEVEESFDFVVRHIPELPVERLSSGSATTVATGPAASRTGAAIAAVEDLNGDGYEEIAIGAPGAAPNARANAGSVYVVSGAKAGAFSLDDPSSYLFRIDGGDLVAGCGAAVAGAGDANGDGVDDLVIGCPGTSTDVGAVSVQPRAYVVFMQRGSNGSVDLGALGARGYRIDGPAVELNLPAGAARHRAFAGSVAGATRGLTGVPGDVNGDDLDDIVIGSSNESPGGVQGAGAAYVIFGKSDAAAVNSAALAGKGLKLSGASTGEAAGYDVALAGDVNDDGLADIAVGAPLAAPDGRKDAGRAYVAFGRPTGDFSLGNLANDGQVLNGPDPGAFAGASLAPAGDVDFDGFSDLAIGLVNGAVIVPAVTTPRSVNTTAAPGAQRLTGPTQPTPTLGLGDVPGATVETAQDIDDDTQPDLLVGFPAADTDAGSTYAVYGDENRQDLNLPTAPGQRATRIDGAPTTRSGTAMAAPRAPSPNDTRLYAGAPGGRTDAGSTSGTRTYGFQGATTRNASARAASITVYKDPQNPYTVTFLSSKGTNSTPFMRRTLAGNLDRPQTPVGQDRKRDSFGVLQKKLCVERQSAALGLRRLIRQQDRGH